MLRRGGSAYLCCSSGFCHTLLLDTLLLFSEPLLSLSLSLSQPDAAVEVWNGLGVCGNIVQRLALRYTSLFHWRNVVGRLRCGSHWRLRNRWHRWKSHWFDDRGQEWRSQPWIDLRSYWDCENRPSYGLALAIDWPGSKGNWQACKGGCPARGGVPMFSGLPWLPRTGLLCSPVNSNGRAHRDGLKAGLPRAWLIHRESEGASLPTWGLPDSTSFQSGMYHWHYLGPCAFGHILSHCNDHSSWGWCESSVTWHVGDVWLQKLVGMIDLGETRLDEGLLVGTIPFS